MEICYLDSSHYSHEERHSICQKMHDIYHVIHENSDFGYMDEDRLGRLCFRMAQDSAMLGDSELEKMVEHFDRMATIKSVDHTSILINTLSSDESTVRRKDEENIYAAFLRYLNKRIECFERIEDNPRFNAVKNKLIEKSQA